MSQNLVLEGVARKDASAGRSLMQRLFAVWFDAFVYNQIWEDPRADLDALAIEPDSDILTISSGGCNALNYLLARPRSVTAVDLNRHHILLLNLKIAAARHLPDHERFFAFFGIGRSADAESDFARFIEPNLDPETRSYWRSRTGLRRRPRLRYFASGGLYDQSRNGRFLKFFQQFSRLVGCRPERLLEARGADEQAEFFDRHIAPFFDSGIIRIAGKLPVTMFGLGIPPQQYDELKKDLGGRSVIDIYRERVRRLAVDFPIDENYFAWQAFARRYDCEHRKALPEYLKAEHFQLLKESVERLETGVGPITEMIRDSDFGRFDRFVFLDAQDWMDAAALNELWSAIASKARPGSRIIFRTAGAESPLETALRRDLRVRFRYDAAASQRLFKQDRASIYGGFHLYFFEG